MIEKLNINFATVDEDGSRLIVQDEIPLLLSEQIPIPNSVRQELQRLISDKAPKQNDYLDGFIRGKSHNRPTSNFYNSPASNPPLSQFKPDPFKVSTGVEPGYHVDIGEIATSNGYLKTAGLHTCVGLGIALNDRTLLAHIHANSSPGHLAYHVKNFLKDAEVNPEDIKVIIYNGGTPLTKHAHEVAMKALGFAGIPKSSITYDSSYSGSFMIDDVSIHPNGM